MAANTRSLGSRPCSSRWLRTTCQSRFTSPGSEPEERAIQPDAWAIRSRTPLAMNGLSGVSGAWVSEPPATQSGGGSGIRGWMVTPSTSQKRPLKVTSSSVSSSRTRWMASSVRLPALAQRDAHRIELGRVPPHRHPEPIPPPRQEVDRGDLLGQDHRMAQRKDQRSCPQPDPRGDPGGRREDDERVEPGDAVDTLRYQQVIDHPDVLVRPFLDLPAVVEQTFRLVITHGGPRI